jgi:DNA-binding IclR family transcriptional regulator
VRAEDPIDRYSKLRTLLDATTTRGFAIERGSVTPGFSSVAVPVLDHREWPVAAIAVTFRDEEVPEDRLEALAADVRETAGTLAARIHGRAQA